MADMATTSNKSKTETFGDRLISAAKARNAPTTQLGLSDWFSKNHEIQVSGPMISRYKKDELPRMDQCRDYAVALGVCVEWLFTGEGTRYPVDGPMTETESRVLAMWRTWTPAVKRYVFSQMKVAHYTPDIAGSDAITEQEIDDLIIDTVTETGEFIVLGENDFKQVNG